MAAPPWEPASLPLLRVGSALLLMGTAVLGTKPLETRANLPPRARVILAASLSVTAYYSVARSPELADLMALGSAALLVSLPLVVVARVLRELLGSD